MTEWLKVRAWKVRIPQKGIVGSNPAFSANGVRNLGVNSAPLVYLLGFNVSLNPSLPNHVINRVQVVPSCIDYHKKQGFGSAATAVRFRLLIDQFND